MTVQEKVLAMLKAKVWTTSGEFEDAFPKGTPGHMSWDQRLRDIRKEMVAKGGDVLSRIHSGKTWEYRLIEPDATPLLPEPVTPLPDPVYFERAGQYSFIGGM